MHLMIPFAAPASEAGRQALTVCPLPNLSALLAAVAEPRVDPGDDTSLTPPHERVLAQALGLDSSAASDGRHPWGAWHAGRTLGADAATLLARPGGLLTPCHWHVATDQVTMIDPDDLHLDDAEARTLIDSVRDLFETEGFELRYLAPTRWWLGHDSLGDLATASPDRVIGRDIDPWLPRSARLWRRLQNEVQMRWHEHPVNESRESRGLPPVNSLWLSGCGRWPAGLPLPTDDMAPGGLQIDDRLRRPALAGDWGAWTEAWAALDAGPLAAMRQAPGGPARRLTLCGESSAATYTLGSGSAWQKLASAWRRTDARAVLRGGL